MKYCPFCKTKQLSVFGRLSRTEPNTYLWHVYCRNCRAHGPLKEEAEDAIKAWDNRKETFFEDLCGCPNQDKEPCEHTFTDDLIGGVSGTHNW